MSASTRLRAPGKRRPSFSDRAKEFFGNNFSAMAFMSSRPYCAGGNQTGGMEMDLTSLLVQLASGAVGGSAAGAAAKQYSLGALGNAIAGAVGGGVVGQLLGTVLGQAVEGWVGNITGGAVGGMILTVLIGVIRSMTAK